MMRESLLSLILLGVFAVIRPAASAHVDHQLQQPIPDATRRIEWEREKSARRPWLPTMRYNSVQVGVPNCSSCSVRLPPNTIPYEHTWMWEHAKKFKPSSLPEDVARLQDEVAAWTSPQWFALCSDGSFWVLGAQINLTEAPLGLVIGDSYVSNVRLPLLNVSHYFDGYFLVISASGCQPLLSEDEYRRKWLSKDNINPPNYDDKRCRKFVLECRNAVKALRQEVPILVVASSRNFAPNETDYGHYYTDFADFITSLPVKHPLAFLGTTPSMEMKENPRFSPTMPNAPRWNHPNPMVVNVYNAAQRAVEDGAHRSLVRFLPTAEIFCGQVRLDGNASCMISVVERSGESASVSMVWKDGAGHLTAFGALFLEPLLHRAFESMHETISEMGD